MTTARDLILQFGWNSTAYQILNPGMEHWFPPSRAGVVGFVRHNLSWVAAGAPVCHPDALPDMVGSFENAAQRGGRRVCYVCAAERLASHLRNSPHHATIAIGAQPVWNPARWPTIVQARPSLRAQLHRAGNKGVTIRPWDPHTIDRRALGAILHQWLAKRPMPPMGFLVEPPALATLPADRQVLVALRQSHPVAYLVASPLPLRNGCLIEQIIRTPDAPNGTAELLIDSAMHRFAAQGQTYLTMGLVALSTHAQTAMNDNPLWVRALMSWARAHGRRFYNFDGLERFRAKMAPDRWETIYAIANEPRFSPQSLWSIAAAFTHGSPFSALASALAAGMRTELRRLLPR